MDEKAKRKEIYENMAVPSAVLAMAGPTVISQLISLIYNTADTFFIGRLGDPLQVAAVSIAAPAALMITALSNLFGIGGASMYSRAMGKNESERAGQIASFSLIAAFLLSLFVAVLAAIFPNALLGILGADADTAPHAYKYILWVFILGAVPSMMSLVMSHFVRANGAAKLSGYVLAGGGNTSYKNQENLWIKGSGSSLATIREEDFVVMDRRLLDHMCTKAYPRDEAQREAEVLADTMAARVPGETRRPSVETLLHDLFPYSFILHAHPTMVNGLTCSVEGAEALKRLLPDAVWVEATKPGYLLALACKRAMDQYRICHGRDAQVVFLQNHGLFVAADTVEEIDSLAQRVMDTLRGAVREFPDRTETAVDRARVVALKTRLQTLMGPEATVEFYTGRDILAYDPATGCLSPDHIVYARASQLALGEDACLEDEFRAYTDRWGNYPRIVFVEGLGMFACGKTEKEAATAAAVMMDGIAITVYARSFGGVRPMPPELVEFIIGWEVERYRSKVSLG